MAKANEKDKAKDDEVRTASTTLKNEPDQSKAGETTIVDGHPQALDGVPPGASGSGAPAPEHGTGPGAPDVDANAGGGMEGAISDGQGNDAAEVTANPATDGPLPGTTGGGQGAAVGGLYVQEGPKGATDPGKTKGDPQEFHYPGGEAMYNSDRAMLRKGGLQPGEGSGEK